MLNPSLFLMTLVLLFSFTSLTMGGVEIDGLESLDGWRTKPGGFVLQSEQVREGNGAAAFVLVPGNSASRSGFEEDWTPYEALAFWAYCEAPGDGVFGVSLTTLGVADEGWSYFLYLVPADWSGWKRFVIRKDQFRKVRHADWGQINLLKFSLEWDGATRPAPEQVVIIDDLRLLSANDLEASRPE